MSLLKIKKRLDKEAKNKIVFIVTGGIACVLLVAAYGKWVHPAELLKLWDRGISMCEIIFIAVLLYFRSSWKMWLGTTFLFASWGGYAYFWHRLHLPCGCMGAALQIPTSLSLSFDGLFFILGLTLTWWLGGKRKGLYWGLLLGACGFGIGFLAAQEIYTHFVMATGG